MDLNVPASSACGRRAGVRDCASTELAVNFGRSPVFRSLRASMDETSRSREKFPLPHVITYDATQLFYLVARSLHGR